jgi:hypothetical protein
MDWMEEAACIGKDITWWFPDFLDADGIDIPDDGQIGLIVGITTPEYETARAICNTCPVKAQCLKHALINKERYGMWG